MTIKLLLKILFFAVVFGVPFSMILEYKDIAIRNLHKKIKSINDFIYERACRNCPGYEKHCSKCKFNEILNIITGAK